MDTIDISNLNRQFLFTAEDVGSSKAQAAARAVMRRFGGEGSGGVTITPHHARIEDMPREFYAQFHIIVLGLDSLDVVSFRSRLEAKLPGVQVGPTAIFDYPTPLDLAAHLLASTTIGTNGTITVLWVRATCSMLSWRSGIMCF